MDFGHVSPKILLLTEDNRTITFKKWREKGEEIPDPKECEGRLKGICLTYAFCGEQDFGIEKLAEAFGFKGDKWIVTNVPLQMTEKDGIKAIKYGFYDIDKKMIDGAKKAGIIGYWDDSNLIICASKEYGFVIDSIWNMFRPNHVRFGFHTEFLNVKNLLILSV